MQGALTFTGIILKEDRTYSALCLELDVASQGKTVRAAKDALAEATSLYLESAIENNLPYMRPVPPTEDPRRTTPKDIVEKFQFSVKPN